MACKLVPTNSGVDTCKYEIRKEPNSWGEAVQFRTFLQPSDYPLHGDEEFPEILRD